MKFKFATLFLAVLVFGSIALAYFQGDQLEGNLSKSTTTTPAHTTDSSILHISSNAEQDTNVSWSANEVDTLGKWRIKADEKLTINGINFYLGDVTAMGSPENFLRNFFESCSITLTESGTTVGTYPSTVCLNSYTNFDLDAGKTYTLTLTASPVPEASGDFYDGAYDGKQVALTLVGLTPNNGTQVKYNSTSFPQLVEQKKSVDTVEAGKHITVEYTFGGYNLINTIYAVEAHQNTPSVEAGTQVIQNQSTTYTKTSTYTTGITETTGNLIGNLLSLDLGDTSKITEDLTITVSKGGSSIKISNGSTTKNCTNSSSDSGIFSCQLPQ